MCTHLTTMKLHRKSQLRSHQAGSALPILSLHRLQLRLHPHHERQRQHLQVRVMPVPLLHDLRSDDARGRDLRIIPSSSERSARREEEARGRLSEVSEVQVQEVPAMHSTHPEEQWLRPHDMQIVPPRVLLDLSSIISWTEGHS